MVHELEFGRKDKLVEKEHVVYVLPRSKDPNDYALISRVREKEILRQGLEYPLEFQGYAPVLENVQAKVKEFLHNKLVKRYEKNYSLRRKLRWGSAFGIICCLTFMFSGMIDDLIFDPLFLGTIGYTLYRELNEKRNLKLVQEKIEAIKFIENPLLTAVFNDFAKIDSKDYHATDWPKILEQMPPDQRQKTLRVISEYIDKNNKQQWQRKLAYLECDRETKDPFSLLYDKIMCAYYRKKLDRLNATIKHRKMLRPGYYEVYEHLLEKS